MSGVVREAPPRAGSYFQILIACIALCIDFGEGKLQFRRNLNKSKTFCDTSYVYYIINPYMPENARQRTKLSKVIQIVSKTSSKNFEYFRKKEELLLLCNAGVVDTDPKIAKRKSLVRELDYSSSAATAFTRNASAYGPVPYSVLRWIVRSCEQYFWHAGSPKPATNEIGLVWGAIWNV